MFAKTKERCFACNVNITSQDEMWVIEPKTTVIVRRKETIRDEIGVRHNVLLTPELSYLVTTKADIACIWDWYQHRFEKEWPHAVTMTNYVWNTFDVKERAVKLVWADCPWLIPLAVLGAFNEDCNALSGI